MLYLGYDILTHCHTDDLPIELIKAGCRIALKPKDSKYSGGIVISRHREEEDRDGGTCNGGKEMAVIQLDVNSRRKTIELTPYYARQVFRLTREEVNEQQQQQQLQSSSKSTSWFEGTISQIGRVLVVGETIDFRLCSRLQVFPSDFCVEIGSSYGSSSISLSRYCRKTVGFDCSTECVEEARRRYPDLIFIAVDCFKDASLVKEHSKGCNVVLIDIGGDRCIPDQLEMLHFVMSQIRPEFVIIKSRKLFHQIRDGSSGGGGGGGASSGSSGAIGGVGVIGEGDARSGLDRTFAELAEIGIRKALVEPKDDVKRGMGP